MPSLPRLLAGLGLALASLTAAHAADIAVERPYARATAPGQPAGGAYLRVDNHGKQADRLVAARADVARTVELHEMHMQGDVMRMRQIDGIAIPANGSVELKPGGLHIMLMGLKQPLKDGDRFPLTLTFEKAGDVKVEVPVQTIKAEGHDAAGHDHGSTR